MDIIKLFVEVFEQDLFSTIGVISWLDFAACVVSYVFVGFVATVLFILPLAFFFLLFFSPFL